MHTLKHYLENNDFEENSKNKNNDFAWIHKNKIDDFVLGGKRGGILFQRKIYEKLLEWKKKPDAPTAWRKQKYKQRGRSGMEFCP